MADITQIVDALLNLPLEDQGYIDQRKAAKELRDSDNVTGKKLGSALLRHVSEIQPSEKDRRTDVVRLIIRLGLQKDESPFGALSSEEVKVPNDPYDNNGTFATLYKGEYDGQIVAVKRLRDDYARPNDSMDLNKYVRNIAVWKLLSHENLLPYVGVVIHRSRFLKRYEIVAPWIENGSIVKYLEQQPGSNRIDLALQVTNGLYYMHEIPCIHANLKSTNVLIQLIGDRPRAVISDFNYARMPPKSDKGPGTTESQSTRDPALGWLAPELLKSKSTKPTRESDMYSMGLLLHNVFVGKLPFEDLERAWDAQHPICRHPSMQGEKPPSWHDNAGDPKKVQIWLLMQRCWREDRKSRVNVKELQESLSELQRS